MIPSIMQMVMSSKPDWSEKFLIYHINERVPHSVNQPSGVILFGDPFWEDPVSPLNRTLNVFLNNSNPLSTKMQLGYICYILSIASG